MRTFKLFSGCASLKPNILDILKCKVAAIGSLKEVKMAVCIIKCIVLTTETIKVLGVYFSYNKKLQIQKSFVESITNIQNVFNLWRIFLFYIYIIYICTYIHIYVPGNQPAKICSKSALLHWRVKWESSKH